MTRTIRLALVGLGNVGQSFLDLMVAKAALLADRYGLALVLTGVADSSAAALNSKGLNPTALRAHKSAGKPLHSFPGSTPGMSAPEMVAEVEADVLLEASAVNLKTGQPGLECVRIAIRRGMDVVLANKGPLVHAFGELETAANTAGVGLAYSATVCGALPVVNIGRRDLAACDIRSVAGIFNSTSNSILAAMARGGIMRMPCARPSSMASPRPTRAWTSRAGTRPTSWSSSPTASCASRAPWPMCSRSSASPTSRLRRSGSTRRRARSSSWWPGRSQT